MVGLQQRSTRFLPKVTGPRLAMFSPEGGLLAMCLLATTFSWRLVQHNSVVRRLRSQHQRLAELEEMKSTYLRPASHELRTPTGRTVEMAIMDIARPVDGKVVETWHIERISACCSSSPCFSPPRRPITELINFST